jgi:hypothetical protein
LKDNSCPQPQIDEYREIAGEYLGLAVAIMNLGYDIFKKLDDGSPLWIMQVATIDDAKKDIEDLIYTMPAEYFIRDASTGEVVFKLGPTPLA